MIVITISVVVKCKYLGAPCTKSGKTDVEMSNRVNKDRNIIRYLNFFL